MNKISEDMVVVDTISTDLATLLIGPGEVEMIVEAGELPEGIQEGDWLKISKDGEFEIMSEFTKDRKKIVRSKLNMLRNN